MPKVKVYIPIQLRDLTKKKNPVEVEAKTVAGAISSVGELFKEFREGTKKRRITSILLNGREIPFPKTLDNQEVTDGDKITLYVYVPMCGG